MALDDRTDLAREVLAGLEALDASRDRVGTALAVDEVGVVTFTAGDVCRVRGLPGVAVDEVVRFENGRLGVAADLGEDEVGVTLLESGAGIGAGTRVSRTGSVLGVPVVSAGVGYSDSRAHAPNENVDLDYFVKGIRHTARIIAAFGEQ